MRLRSDIWVAAYLRRRNADGAFAALRRRGAAEAGAIVVKLDRLDGRVALYGPARNRCRPIFRPASTGCSRACTSRNGSTPPTPKRGSGGEVRFDPDLWIVEVEDRDGEPRLDLAQ